MVDMSIADTVSDVNPIFMTRLVDDSGWSMTGGAAQVGSVAVTAVMRSCTICRALQEIGPAVEQHHDVGELGNRLRANRVETRQPDERLLDGNGDQLLGLLRGTARW